MVQIVRGLCVCILLLPGSMIASEPSAERRHTVVSIVGDEFYINGKPTYVAQSWRGHKIQGLLLNARLVQGIFDDRNTNTVAWWAYPDTARWEPERNTREFIAAMPEWHQHGLLAFTINLQGGSPRGYVQAQHGTIQHSSRMARCGRITRGGLRESWTVPTSSAWLS
jgi:hypothetical protein